MSKKSIILLLMIIAVAVIAVVLILTLCCGSGKTPDITATPSETTSPAPVVIPPIEGNDSLSFERHELLEDNILSQINGAKKGVAAVDDNGNYIIDNNGDIVYETFNTKALTVLEKNLNVIVNTLTDDGYDAEAVTVIQRFYFEYFDQLAAYGDEIIPKLEVCFIKRGNTAEDVAKNAYDIFGFERADGFAFLFESTVPAAEVKILFFDVAQTAPELTADEEMLCIYDKWEKDEAHDRNLEAYLNIIVKNLRNAGCNDYDTVLGQLLYAAYISDTEYKPEWIYLLCDCLTCYDNDREVVNRMVAEAFDTDISDSALIDSYFNGLTEFN